MKKTTGKIIVIKIGSAGLISANGKIRRSVIKEMARQTKLLHSQGYSVCIVTSGAVACAKNLDCSKNLRSAVGQPRLMSAYVREFGRYGIQIAQVLLTDRELEEGNSGIVRSVILEAFEEKIVCVINANDAIDSEELCALELCADNDKLFSLICQKIGGDVGIIVFAEKGFRDDCGNFVKKVFCQNLKRYLSYAKGGSSLGHGQDGMSTKLKILCYLAQLGKASHLVSVQEKDFILRAVKGEKDFGTKFMS